MQNVCLAVSSTLKCCTGHLNWHSSGQANELFILLDATTLISQNQSSPQLTTDLCVQPKSSILSLPIVRDTHIRRVPLPEA